MGRKTDLGKGSVERTDPPEERREYLKTVGALVGGLVIGGAAAWLGKPAERVAEIVTKTVSGPTVTQTVTVTPTPTPPPDVRLGQIWTLTGRAAELGATIRRSIELITEEVNAAGGIKSLGGAKIVNVWADNKSEAMPTATETERLITKEGVCMVLGAFLSACTKAGAPVAERYGTPWVMISGSDALLMEGYKWSFRSHGCASMIDLKPVEYYKAMGVRSVAIMCMHDEWGVSTKKVYEWACPTAGIEIKMSELIDPASVDLSPILGKVKATGAEAILSTHTIEQALLLARQVIEMKIPLKAICAGADGMSTYDFIKTGGDIAEGCCVGVLYSPDATIPCNIRFKEKFEKKYGYTPDVYAGNAYEIMQVTVDALERAGSTKPDKIREALLATNMITVSGPTIFGTVEGPFGTMVNQNIYNNTCVIQVQKGKWVTIWPPQIAVAKPRFPYRG